MGDGIIPFMQVPGSCAAKWGLSRLALGAWSRRKALTLSILVTLGGGYKRAREGGGAIQSGRRGVTNTAGAGAHAWSRSRAATVPERNLRLELKKSIQVLRSCVSVAF